MVGRTVRRRACRARRMYIQHQRHAARMGGVMETQVKSCKWNKDTTRELLDCILESIIPPHFFDACYYTNFSDSITSSVHSQCSRQLGDIMPRTPSPMIRASLLLDGRCAASLPSWGPFPWTLCQLLRSESVFISLARSDRFTLPSEPCSFRFCHSLQVGRPAEGTRRRTVSISLC